MRLDGGEENHQLLLHEGLGRSLRGTVKGMSSQTPTTVPRIAARVT